MLVLLQNMFEYLAIMFWQNAKKTLYCLAYDTLYTLVKNLLLPVAESS